MNNDSVKKAALTDQATLAAQLQTSLSQGLAQQEAHARLQKYGPNQLPQEHRWWIWTLWDQFQSPFIYLLLLICGLMVFLGDTTNALITLAIVALNTVVGFYQEYKAAQTFAALQKLMVLHSTVIRDGVEKNIPTSELVPGDLIVLYPGDIIPADARLIEHEQLLINESSLTGESLPINKQIASLSALKESARPSNIVFTGTTVISGKGKALVVATGVGTSLGEIVRLVTEEIPPSPFAKGIAGISRFMVLLTAGTIALLIIAHLLIMPNKLNIFELIMFAAALGVSVIPEALPVVITFCLTRGAALLAAHQVVVKRLSSIEDLGSMQILCTDKTGTLTENKMTISQIYGDHETVLWYGTLGSGLTLEALGRAKGFDAAIFAALPAQKHSSLHQYEKKNEIPFDPERRKSIVAYQGPQGIELVFRGAPEAIISLCTFAESEQKEINQWIHEQGIEGKRILGIAQTSLSKIPASLELPEAPVQFIGLIAFADPLKPTAQEAVQKAKDLGLKIKILSGDTVQVCGAIGVLVGIIENQHQVIEGSAFELLPSEQKHKAVQEFNVFARVTPTQKYDIIKLLQEKSQVGFIGDGINDAPALRIAHVAIAVDDAADIALQSADIILLHKSLRVIVDGISYGRMTFINTMKFLKTTLAGNLGNFYAIGIASLFIDYVPMLPTQLLLLNFLSDIPLIALSTDTVDEQEISTPQRYDMRDLALLTIILGIVSTLFDFMIFAYFYRATPATLQTNWFIASIATELAFMFSIRTSKFMLRSSLPSFTLLLLAGIVAAVGIILPYSSFGHYYFHFVSPQPAHLIIIGVIVFLYLIATELIKLLYNRTVKC